MRKIILALAMVAGVAAASAVTPAPALAQDFSVRIGGGDGGWRDRDDWRWRHRYSEHRYHPGFYAQVRPSFCRTIIVRERHGPVVVRKTIRRC
jgi:hypothetical protein